MFFCAESLESRQLLSVAAFHPAIAPVANVPAAVGPLVPSSVGTQGTAGSAAGSNQGIQVVLEFNPVVSGQSSFHGFTETIFIFEQPSANGIGAHPHRRRPGVRRPTPDWALSRRRARRLRPRRRHSQAITPLTATILAAPGSGNRTAVIAIVLPQTLVTNLRSSTIPVTTQAILATATLEEQPIQPPVLGQGFESGQTQGTDLRPENGLFAPKAPVPLEPQLPAIDFIEPFRPEPVNPPAAQPAEPVGPPAPRGMPSRSRPSRSSPATPTDLSRSPEFPILPPVADSQTEDATPSWSMAAMVGTAAIASGGYHLVLGGSNRFNQRWFPTRGSSNEESRTEADARLTSPSTNRRMGRDRRTDPRRASAVPPSDRESLFPPRPTSFRLPGPKRQARRQRRRPTGILEVVESPAVDPHHVRLARLELDGYDAGSSIGEIVHRPCVSGNAYTFPWVNDQDLSVIGLLKTMRISLVVAASTSTSPSSRLRLDHEGGEVRGQLADRFLIGPAVPGARFPSGAAVCLRDRDAGPDAGDGGIDSVLRPRRTRASRRSGLAGPGRQ